jgi:mRNA interferase MazF
VIVGLQGNDLILCQITSRLIRDQYAIMVDTDDFESGSLQQSSNVRPNRLFTADQQIVLYQAGRLKSEKTNEVIAKIIDILQR